MQAIDEMQCLHFPLPPPVPLVINPYLGTIQYCYVPVNHLPMHAPDPVPVPGSVPGVIYQVWKSNLKYEFDRIKKLIEQPQEPEGRLGCWSASIDTEFPGTIYKSEKGRLNDPEYNYEMMKKNVNATKIIQLGLTLADVSNSNTYTWEFNFNDFDIDRDLQDKDSIEFLELHGIDFCKHKVDGIPSHEFAKEFMNVGLLGNERVTWVGFQMLYDMGFFTKILTGMNLPDDFSTYKKAEYFYFGSKVCDVKVGIKNWFPTLYGGLDKVAETLGITRTAGKSHQAGSDSLLTYVTYITLQNYTKQYV